MEFNDESATGFADSKALLAKQSVASMHKCRLHVICW